jgi:fructose-1,6-bisphosphatase/inositol monophosphatase family enzyme
MSSGTSGSDEKISAAKIEPLSSDQKAGVTHDLSSRGVTGTDSNIDQTRIDPIGGKGQYIRGFALFSSSLGLGKEGAGCPPRGLPDLWESWVASSSPSSGLTSKSHTREGWMARG